MKVWLRKLVPKDFFKLIIVALKCWGLLPPKKLLLRILYHIIYAPVVFNCIIIVSLQGIQIYKEIYGNLKGTLFNLTLFLAHLMAVARLFGWFFAKYRFFGIIDILRRESFIKNPFNFEYNLEPKILNLETGSYNEIKMYWQKVGSSLRAENKVNFRRTSLDTFREEHLFVTSAICTAHYMTFNFFIIICFISAYSDAGKWDTYEGFNPYLNKTSVYKNYPFVTYIPFDNSLSDGHYWISYFYQCYSYIIIPFLFACIDIFTIASLMHLRTHLLVIKKSLEMVDKNLNGIPNENSKNFIRRIRLVHCASEIQEIMNGVQVIEDIFSVPLTIQLMISTVIYCNISYMIPLLDSSYELIMGLVILLVLLIEPLMTIWHIHLLAEEFSDLATSLYCELNWIDYPPSLRRDLALIMTRLRRPVGITLVKMYRLNMQFYVQMLKLSYSFYTLISITSK